MAEPEIISSKDVTTGLLLILARHGRTSLATNTESFDRAVLRLYNEAPELAKEYGALVRFPLGLHAPDMLDLFDYTLQVALKKTMLVRDPENPGTLLLHTSPLISSLFLASLPGSERLYKKLADVFLDAYDHAPQVVR